MAGSIVALETYLAPLEVFFQEEGVTEISINRAGEVWTEKYGELFSHQVPALDLDHLRGLSNLIAESTDQFISEENPLLSATLPQGYRIQVVFPPVAEPRSVYMSIRKQTVLNFNLEEYEKLGAFENIAIKDEESEDDRVLQELLEAYKIRDFLEQAILRRKNIIISGGTSTGKTTFGNAILQSIPANERLITVEDAREVHLPQHPNHLHLISSKGGQGRAQVTTQDLIEACLRLRPDRIIVGELRGKEAFSFLRAINTGHPGSIATLHADSPALAFEQLILMVMQAGLGLSRDQIEDYVHTVIDVVVQLKRGEKGRRFVSEISFPRGKKFASGK